MVRRFSFLTFFLFFVSCGSQVEVTQQATTQFFVQDFNPENLDILWVVDDRSPMYDAREKLTKEARKFFTRLDAIPGQYRMAFTSVDMEISHGELKPQGNPVILEKNRGSIDERSVMFSNLLFHKINLHTGGTNRGFESAITALKTAFRPRANVPFVIVFFSDSDDYSPLPSGVQDGADFYAKEFLKLVDNKKELLRVYSINYRRLEAGESGTENNRCATLYDADIDFPGFKDSFFALARRLSESENVTTDLCGSFSEKIDLSGLRLKNLPVRFKLNATPQKNSIRVAIVKGIESFEVPWTFDETSNEVVFQHAPPEGTTVQITYHKGN